MSSSKRDRRGHSTGDIGSGQASTPPITGRARSDRFKFRQQLSRVDWGSVRDLGGSLVGVPFGSFGSSGTGTPGSSMAEAAAAASYELDGVSGAHLDGSGSDRYAPSSRYDPNTMKRIVDITDLADSDGDSDATEGTGNGGRIARKKQKKNQGSSPCRQALAIIASIGVIVGASFGIRALVINNQNSNPKQHSTSSSASFQVQQRLLEIAEEVVWACSERTLNDDMSHCQDVCHGQLCCVDGEGEYSCEDDESRNCAVYAGCRALVDGQPVNENAAVTSVGRMTHNKWG